MSEASATKDQAAYEAWGAITNLVFDNERRREVTEKVGLSFGKLRALRRIASGPMSMRELADSLNVDPTNLTSLVDDLEKIGVAERRTHPTDRRVKLVATTAKGARMARRAEEILQRPPEGLAKLSAAELGELVRLLQMIRER